MDSFLMYCSICCCLVLSTDGVTLTLEMKSILPLKGSSLQLSCRILEPLESNAIVVYKGTSELTICYGDSYLCDFYKVGYSFTVNRTGAFGSISSLTTEAEGTWRCSYRGTSGDIYSNTWNVIVYTIPPGLSITQNPNQNVDLSVGSVELKCKTTGCTYPMPTIQWTFQDQTSSSVDVNARDNLTGIQESCASQEKIYTSTLNLQLYTTLNDNSDRNVTFSCRIGYPDPSRNIMASGSNTVRFAVRVTEAVLQQNNQNITETLNVTLAEPVTLTCVTGTSRPAPTINWYIGLQKKGSESSLTITFSNMDHNEMIYCQAYNTDPRSLVSSAKPRLFVQVRVIEAVLQENNQNITETLNVTSAEPVTLTCVTGTSRPAPTIEWYIGSIRIGDGHSLTFTFSNLDHSEMIFCQAYNTDPRRPVSSAKPRLFVRVNVTAVTLIASGNGMVVFYEGVSQSLSCASSPSRPIPTIRWWLGNRQVTNNITIMNSTDSSNLHVQTSNVTLIMARGNTNQTIYCDGTIIDQEHPATSKNLTVDVLYAPDVNVTIDGLTEENVSLSVTCEVKGVPAQYIFYPWIHMFRDFMIRSNLTGTPTGRTSSSHNTLMLARLSLQDMGTYICSAENGISGNNGNAIQTGTVHLKVTGIPNVIKEEKNLFAEEVGHSINISIPFYSHPAIMDFMFKRNDTTVMNNSKTSTHLSNDTVDYKLYGRPVKLEAQVAHLVIQNLTLHDFDNYTLVLVNSLGKRTFRVQLDATGPPLMVNRFYFSQFIEDQIELNFEPGFNGGRVQTFVIEYKSATDHDMTWINSSVPDLKETNIRLHNGAYTVKVTQPSPGNYTYRMYSWNDIGRSPYSTEITVIIPEVNMQQVQAGSSVAAIAGGIGAAVVIIAVVSVVLAFIKRRSKSSDEELKRELQKQERKESGLVDNPVYDASSKLPSPSISTSAVGTEYAVVVKPKHPQKTANIEEINNVYAQVDKKKNKTNKKVSSKGKQVKASKAASKGKQGKTSRGDVYENATLAMKSSAENVYENPGPLAAGEPSSGENVYENPEVSASKGQLVKKDGLLYADLAIGPPTTKAGKPVIHGLENQTEYAEIAYGKRGEPLPESIEEKETGGAKKNNGTKLNTDE